MTQDLTKDPRPRTVGGRIAGCRCDRCGQTSLDVLPRCAVCRGAVSTASFGPDGTVWSATVLRIEVPGRSAPRALAYVDLDEGPRLLVHVRDVLEAPAGGARVRLVEPNEQGDPQVEVRA